MSQKPPGPTSPLSVIMLPQSRCGLRCGLIVREVCVCVEQGLKLPKSEKAKAWTTALAPVLVPAFGKSSKPCMTKGESLFRCITYHHVFAMELGSGEYPWIPVNTPLNNSPILIRRGLPAIDRMGGIAYRLDRVGIPWVNILHNREIRTKSRSAKPPWPTAQRSVKVSPRRFLEPPPAANHQRRLRGKNSLPPTIF